MYIYDFIATTIYMYSLYINIFCSFYVSVTICVQLYLKYIGLLSRLGNFNKYKVQLVW